MTRTKGATFGPLVSALLAVALVAAAFPLLSANGVVARQTALDFGYFIPWIASAGVLLALGAVAAAVRNYLIAHPHDSSSEGEEEEDQEGQSDSVRGEERGSRRLASSAQSLLGGLGVVVLSAGALAAVSGIPATVSARPGAADLEVLGTYLAIFGSLSLWVIVVPGLFVAARSSREYFPWIDRALPMPVKQFAALGIAYVLLAREGVLAVAFGFPGGLLLLLIAVAFALSYLASSLRIVTSYDLSSRALIATRVTLLLTDCGRIALLLGVMVSLPRVADGISDLRPGGSLETLGAYLEVLDRLAFWSIILLVPFLVISAAAAIRPAIGEVFGFPMGRITLFAIALILFSDTGILATASKLPIPQLMPALSSALAISYIALVLRRVSGLGLTFKFRNVLANVAPLVGSLMPTLSISLVVWALFASLPSVSAPLLDGGRTAYFGLASMPYFAAMYEIRFTFAAFVFAVLLVLALPNPLWSPARWHIRPMLAAIGFTASGCLLWISGSSLASLGHGCALFGAAIGAGLLTLGVAHLAAYGVNSPEQTVADAARWLLGSKLRGFLIGGALAFYGMFLRPLMYDALWFAEVYEWVAVLALAVWALLKIRGSLKTFVETSEASPASWTGWNRHEQRFEERPDPRWNAMERWRQRFIESGDWSSLWTYLMGLLCRNSASPQSVRAVFRPLREASPTVGTGIFWRGSSDRNRQRREAALGRCLKNAEHALSLANATPGSVDESIVKESAQRFIQSGEEPETMTANVIAAYLQKGADINAAVGLWFPLVNSGEAQGGWFEFPWVRRRRRRRAQERRRKLVEGAISHLSGKGTHVALPVGVASTRAPISPTAIGSHSLPNTTHNGPDPSGGATPEPVAQAYPTSAHNQSDRVSRFTRHQLARASTQASPPVIASPRVSRVIAPGQAFELVGENDFAYLVRTSDEMEGYVAKSALGWQPILPGDEVGAV